MKVLNIHAKSKEDILTVARMVRFNGKLGLVTTIQNVHMLEEVQKIIPNSIICGQVLGCDASLAIKHENEVDAFLYLGSGKFHPLEVAMHTNKKVICANPITNEITEITPDEVESRRNRIKGAYLKFLAAKKIGIIVTIKSGQGVLPLALRFKNHESMKDKESFIFLCNTLNFNELENYPDIECWVNTACPRIATEDNDKLTKPMINLEVLNRNYPLVPPYIIKDKG